MNLVPKKQLILIVPFQATQYRKKELCADNRVRETIGDVYCLTCRNEKRVYISTNKMTTFYDCKKCKACCNISFSGPKTDNYFVWRWRYPLFCRKGESRLQKRKTISIFEEISPPMTTKHIRTWTKKIKMSPNMEKRYPFPIGWWFERHIHFSNHSFQFQSTAKRSNLFNLHSIYRKSWSSHSPLKECIGLLILIPNSATIAVIDLDQNITISSQEIPLAAWQLLLSQRQDFRDNHLAWVPITQNQEGTMEMRDEVCFNRYYRICVMI